MKNYTELHKPIIRKFEGKKVHSPFIDNIWGIDLADMQLIIIFNKRLIVFIVNVFIGNMHEIFL